MIKNFRCLSIIVVVVNHSGSNYMNLHLVICHPMCRCYPLFYLYICVYEYSCLCMSGFAIRYKRAYPSSEAYRNPSNFVRRWAHFQYEIRVLLYGLTHEKMMKKLIWHDSGQNLNRYSYRSLPPVFLPTRPDLHLFYFFL